MRSVFITGASGDIGRAIARVFAKNGYKVAIGYNSDKKSGSALEEELVSAGYEAFSVKCDITNSDEAKRAVALCECRFGSLDVLINNASVSSDVLFADTDEETWEYTVGTDLTGAYKVTRAALSALKESDSGRIINISSIWGVVGGSGEVAYSAAKAGLIGFTKALARELGPSGITVNAIAPGYIDTKMNARHTEDTVQDIIDRTPLCRLGSPDDVAYAALYFASREASFVTAQTLTVDGGLT